LKKAEEKGVEFILTEDFLVVDDFNKSETKKNINQFLQFHRVAFVGVSSNKKDFSRGLFKEFQKHIDNVHCIAMKS